MNKAKSNTAPVKKPSNPSLVKNTNVKMSKEEKKKLRKNAKFNSGVISILCTNGKKLITKSTLAKPDQSNSIEIYSDPFMHNAWNKNKAKNIIDKNSSFAKKFKTDLSSF